MRTLDEIKVAAKALKDFGVGWCRLGELANVDYGTIRKFVVGERTGMSKESQEKMSAFIDKYAKVIDAIMEVEQ